MFNLKEFVSEGVLVDDTTGFKPIVIAPGRFNPPHRGHKLMIDTLVKLGKQLDAKPVVLIIDSKKYGPKNPLTGEQRKEWLQKMFPDIRIEIAPNAYEAVANLADPEKLIPIGGVAGSDRADNYKKMIGRIFGEEAEKKFKAVTLARDPDAEEDTAGASATKARKAAAENDLVKFRALTGTSGEESKNLLKQVRKGMGVE